MEATGRENAGHHVGGLATLEGTETTPAASYRLVSLSAPAYWRLGDSRHSRGLRRYVAIGLRATERVIVFTGGISVLCGDVRDRDFFQRRAGDLCLAKTCGKARFDS